jgi:hypothetical protein
MNLNQALSTARQVLGICAVIAAGVVVIKLFGIASIRGSTIDWTCAAIACALAGR